MAKEASKCLSVDLNKLCYTYQMNKHIFLCSTLTTICTINFSQYGSISTKP